MEDKILEYIDKQTKDLPSADYIDVLEQVIVELGYRVENVKLDLEHDY